jgi:hypothetical protein
VTGIVAFTPVSRAYADEVRARGREVRTGHEVRPSRVGVAPWAWRRRAARWNQRTCSPVWGSSPTGWLNDLFGRQVGDRRRTDVVYAQRHVAQGVVQARGLLPEALGSAGA